MCQRVYRRKSFDPFDKQLRFVQSLLNPLKYAGDIDTLTFGKSKEKASVERYKLQRTDCDVADTGMWVNSQHMWLGASPDGLVTDRRTGELMTLEVKCPT